MRRTQRYLPHIVVFLSSMGVMIIELAASRIISKYFGNSLFTWTGVIGVVLAGISAGNWIGGKWADTYALERIMAPQLFAASLLVFGILALDLLIGWFMGRSGGSGVSFWLVLQSLLVTGVLFFLPAASLGTISPVMVKYALSQSDRMGGTVGTIYALSSVGSILGTFLSGYVLIPLLGVRAIVFVVALVIALLGVWVSRTTSFSKGTSLGVGWTAAILLGFFLWGIAPAEGKGKNPESREEGVLYMRDSPYSHITVKNTEKGTKRILIMDGLIHNMHDLTNPDNLLYEYERIFLALTETFLRDPNRSTKTLTLGGGAMTFPSYLARNYRQARHTVVEIDPKVVEVAYRYFEVPRTEILHIHTVDARLFVQGRQRIEAPWEVIYLDAFNSFSIPYHLTTREFTQGVEKLLHPEGILLANAIDIPRYGRFLGAYYATLSSVFPHVAIYGSPVVDRNRRSTFVLAAARFPIPYEELRDSQGNLVAKRLDPVIQEDILRRNGNRPLTDDYAPVENLMIPVFLDMIR
jgi:spermidine synthase